MRRFSLGAAALIVALGATMARADLKVVPYASGFSLPVAIIQDPANPSVQYVLEQGSGLIRIIDNGTVLPTPFLNVRTRISTGGERGLLGMAFSPNYANDRFFYLNYTAASTGATTIARFSRTDDPFVADPNSFLQVLQISQPFSNHNGGTITFSPLDGYLYIGMGDGGSSNDPSNNSQRTDTLLGKMLRIDVNGDDFPGDPNKNYAIPPDNPFLDGVPVAALPETWAFGLRNPWKWSFDPPALLGSGGMLIGDVGQGAFEELDYEPPLTGARNYGWALKEGFQNTGLNRVPAYQPFQDPFHAYGRTFGASVTGGYIYRGILLGDFFGRYIFADYVAGRVYSLPMTYDSNGEAVREDNRTEHTGDLGSIGNISTFGTNLDGELFIVSFSQGIVYRILPENAVWITGVRRIEGGLSGNARHILSPDDKRLSAVPVSFIRNGQTSPTEFQVDAQTDQLTQSTMAVQVEASISRNTDARLELYARNWTTGQLDLLQTFVTNGTDQVFSVGGLPASTYRSATGQIELRLRSYKISIVINDLFNLLVDQVKVTLS